MSMHASNLWSNSSNVIVVALAFSKPQAFIAVTKLYGTSLPCYASNLAIVLWYDIGPEKTC